LFNDCVRPQKARLRYELFYIFSLYIRKYHYTYNDNAYNDNTYNDNAYNT